MATPAASQLGNHLGNSFAIPPFDYQVFTYVAAGAANDDSVATIVYKIGGASGRIVGTLTFTYFGSTNNVASVTYSV